METITVSGNNSHPDTPQPPVETTETTTYNLDTTQLCELLTALLEEVKKGNETLTKMHETMFLSHTESMDFWKQTIPADTDQTSETPIEETEETETISFEDMVQEQLTTLNEQFTENNDTLHGISTTVSGNSLTLDAVDATTETLSTAYAEQTEVHNDTSSAGVAVTVCIGFLVAILAGLTLVQLTWGKKHE